MSWRLLKKIVGLIGMDCILYVKLPYGVADVIDKYTNMDTANKRAHKVWLKIWIYTVYIMNKGIVLSI